MTSFTTIEEHQCLVVIDLILDINFTLKDYVLPYRGIFFNDDKNSYFGMN